MELGVIVHWEWTLFVDNECTVGRWTIDETMKT